VQATSIESDGTHVTGVSLSDGRHVPADPWWSASALWPNVELARSRPAGRGGIIVNEQLLTSDPNVSAIGDCALFAAIASADRCGLNSVQKRHRSRALRGGATDRRCQDLRWPTVVLERSARRDKLQIAGLTTGYDRVVVRAIRAGSFSHSAKSGSSSARVFNLGRITCSTEKFWDEPVDRTGNRRQIRFDLKAALT